MARGLRRVRLVGGGPCDGARVPVGAWQATYRERVSIGQGRYHYVTYRKEAGGDGRRFRYEPSDHPVALPRRE